MLKGTFLNYKYDFQRSAINSSFWRELYERPSLLGGCLILVFGLSQFCDKLSLKAKVKYCHRIARTTFYLYKTRVI